MEHRFSFPFDVDLVREGLRRDFTDKWFWSLGMLVVMLLASWMWATSFPLYLLVAVVVVDLAFPSLAFPSLILGPNTGPY